MNTITAKCFTTNSNEIGRGSEPPVEIQLAVMAATIEAMIEHLELVHKRLQQLERKVNGFESFIQQTDVGFCWNEDLEIN